MAKATLPPDRYKLVETVFASGASADEGIKLAQDIMNKPQERKEVETEEEMKELFLQGWDLKMELKDGGYLMVRD